GAKQPSENSVGLNWYTIVYPDAAARDETVKKLRQLGATVQEEADYYLTRDPSGNRIRLVV
ncbi:glyoxalase, partial [Alkalihalophilus pseudofirmus]|nr:glyoxalase [Alkalihalophilus pseudofirmus]